MNKKKIYEWRALNEDGQQCAGEIEAESVRDVIMTLHKNGYKDFDHRSISEKTNVVASPQLTNSRNWYSLLLSNPLTVFIGTIVGVLGGVVFLIWLISGLFIWNSDEYKREKAREKRIAQIEEDRKNGVVRERKKSTESPVKKSREKSKSIEHVFEFELDDGSLKLVKVAMLQQGAQDVAIHEKGETINLACMVPYGTSEGRAKSICDNFLRLVKTNSNDSNPTTRIGKGHFSYHVGAFTPDEKWLVQGYKADYSSKITW